MRKLACIVLGAVALVPLAFGAWVMSLPRLDPTGVEDSSAAIVALMEDRYAFNTAAWWPVHRTGWLFFGPYKAEGEAPAKTGD